MPTPTLVQYSTFAGSGNATTLRKVPLPNLVLSGNAVIVCAQCSNGETPTVSDDKSGTYTVLQDTNDTGNGQRAIMAYRLNITDAPSEVRLSFVTARGYLGGFVSEWYNIKTTSATDGNTGTIGSSTTPAPGSITTTQDGDLIITYAVEDSIAPESTTNGTLTSVTRPIDSNSPSIATDFKLLQADLGMGQTAAFWIQSKAGAVNPQFTIAPSRSWICIQGAFQAAAAGTAPTTVPRVVGVLRQGLDYGGTATSPFTVQAPVSSGGDMLYAAYVGLRDPGVITDNKGNAWTATGASILNGGSGKVRGYYVVRPALGHDLNITINFSEAGAAPGDTCFVYECVGMDQAAPFDQHTTATGNQTSGSSFIGPSLTPTSAGGLVFATVGVTGHGSGTNDMVTGVSPGVFLSVTDPNEETSPWATDENNGWGVYRNPDTNAITITWSNGTAGGQGLWASILDAFKGDRGALKVRPTYLLPTRRRRHLTSGVL